MGQVEYHGISAIIKATLAVYAIILHIDPTCVINKTIERSWNMYEKYFWSWSIKYKPTLVLRNEMVFQQNRLYANTDEKLIGY